MDTLNTIYSIILLYYYRFDESLPFTLYGMLVWYALCHVSMSLIILYINAKPMGFSGVQHTLNSV